MCELHHGCSPFLPLACLSLASLFICGVARGQLLNVDQEINVRELPSLLAPSRHSADVLLTSLATIIHDPEVCCGKDSALEDSAQAADPKSLKDVAAKLDGRHLLSDGRPILVSDHSSPPMPSMQAACLGTLLTSAPCCWSGTPMSMCSMAWFTFGCRPAILMHPADRWS